VAQFDKLRKVGAFVENYRSQPMFQDSLDELDDSRCGENLGFLVLSLNI
jgi:hypothetical protein